MEFTLYGLMCGTPQITTSAWPFTGTEYCSKFFSRIFSCTGSVDAGVHRDDVVGRRHAVEDLAARALGQLLERPAQRLLKAIRSSSVKSSSFLPRNSMPGRTCGC
jgi:hypothetical protein